MKFLVDAQLPPMLAEWLRAAGLDAQHVQELGLRTADDSTLWNSAVEAGAAIVTKDIDFAVRAEQAISGPVIGWLRIGNATNEALQEGFEPRFGEIMRLLNEGHRLIEVR